MQAVEQTTADLEVLSPDTIRALQSILAHSRVIISDLETPYSGKFPNPHRSSIQLNNHSVSAILTERQQQLDAVLHNISGLETVMDSVRSLYQQLIEERDKIVHSMVLHRGHMSALWRLPVEVLSQIFVYCLPETNHFKVSSKLAPMLLTRICRHWREVAVGIPSLWCRLSVEVADWSTVNWPQVAFCHCSWLERSRERPLSLAIRHLPSGAPMLQILLRAYSARISSLQITYDDDTIEPELLFQDLPTLHDLMLHWRGEYVNESTIARSISRVPSTLRNLTVIGCFVGPLELQRFSSSNGWAHMTSVDIALYGPHEFLHLLRLCPNLSSLDILLQLRDNVLLRLEPFTHSNLQSLSINHSILWPARDPLHALLNVLTLPNLRVLEARCTPGSMQWPHEPFKAFLTRSKCPLESLIPSLEITIYAKHDDVSPSRLKAPAWAKRGRGKLRHRRGLRLK